MTTAEEIIKRLGIEPKAIVVLHNYGTLNMAVIGDRIEKWVTSPSLKAEMVKPLHCGDMLYTIPDINRIVQEASAEYEARIAELTEAMNKYHACFDMLTDGPDDSDTALAIRWLNEGKALREKILSASSPITALEDERNGE